MFIKMIENPIKTRKSELFEHMQFLKQMLMI